MGRCDSICRGSRSVDPLLFHRSIHDPDEFDGAHPDGGRFPLCQQIPLWGTNADCTHVSAFFHNKISIGGNTIPSYLDWIELPYFRTLKFNQVERNDMWCSTIRHMISTTLEMEWARVEPISVKENYIKRCVAIAGDTFEIRNQQVFINGEPGYNPPNMQYQYQVETNGNFFSQRRLNDLGMRSSSDRRITPNANWQNAGSPTSISSGCRIRLLSWWRAMTMCKKWTRSLCRRTIFNRRFIPATTTGREPFPNNPDNFAVW